MMQERLSLFDIRGTRIWASASLVALATLLFWTLGKAFFPYQIAGLSSSQYWMMALASVLGALASLFVHEGAHLLVDRACGIAPSGVTVFGFGGTEQYRREQLAWRRASLAGALLGPLASVALALVVLGLAYLGSRGQWPRTIMVPLIAVAAFNFLLAAINLIPIYPLDAGKAVRAFALARTGDPVFAMRRGMRGMYVLVVVLATAGALLALRGYIVTGAWFFLLGAALRAAGDSSQRDVVVRSLASGIPVSRIARRHHVAVPSYVRVARAWGAYDDRFTRKLLPVIADGKLVGCITPRTLGRLDRSTWEEATVGELAEPISSANTVAADADLVKVLDLLESTGTPAIMVMDPQGRLEGTVCYSDLAEYVLARAWESKGRAA